MKQIIFALLLCSTFGFSGCSQESELHGAMENMGGAMKTMKQTEEAAKLQSELVKFGAGLNIAKQQKVKPEDQVTFDEGMRKLTAKVTETTTALSSGNVELTKSLLKELHKIEETYHEKLGVKD